MDPNEKATTDDVHVNTLIRAAEMFRDLMKNMENATEIKGFAVIKDYEKKAIPEKAQELKDSLSDATTLME